MHEETLCDMRKTLPFVKITPPLVNGQHNINGNPVIQVIKVNFAYVCLV